MEVQAPTDCSSFPEPDFWPALRAQKIRKTKTIHQKKNLGGRITLGRGARWLLHTLPLAEGYRGLGFGHSDYEPLGKLFLGLTPDVGQVRIRKRLATRASVQLIAR